MTIFGKWAAAVMAVVFTCSFLYAEDPAAFHASQLEDAERERWRFEFDNDVFFNKDGNLSNCWSVQKHSAIASAWDDLVKMPRFAGIFGNHIPTLNGKGLAHRFGLSITQTIQTPNDIGRKDLIKNDVPYAGILILQGSWYAYNDTEFRGFEITAGVVGPPSLGEQSQEAFHKLSQRMLPQGWNNQIRTEPLFELAYMRKKKIWRIGSPGGLSIDSTIDGNAALGNLFTHATAAMELRLGRNMPGGFAHIPNITGYGMNYVAALQPAHYHAGSFYGSLALRATALAHSVFLDGNLFRDSHRVDKKPLVGQIIAGFHYERMHFGVHLYTLASSAVVDIHKVTAAEERELIGLISIELWK
jgi:lipid A 3-O-deacylase